MKIFVVHDFAHPHRGGNLNIRQLLNPIFFDRQWPLGAPHQYRRPDMKRQRSRRQRTKDLKAARELKTQYVPLCKVAPADPPMRFDSYDGAWMTFAVRMCVEADIGKVWRSL